MIQEGDRVCLISTGSNRINWEWGTVTRIFTTPQMLGEAWITTVEGYNIIEYLEYLKRV